MRDLKVHPITDDEILALLDKLAEEYAAKQSMGDIRPLLLRAAASRIRDNPPAGAIDGA